MLQAGKYALLTGLCKNGCNFLAMFFFTGIAGAKGCSCKPFPLVGPQQKKKLAGFYL
jgi:hypothetical protein